MRNSGPLYTYHLQIDVQLYLDIRNGDTQTLSVICWLIEYNVIKASELFGSAQTTQIFGFNPYKLSRKSIIMISCDGFLRNLIPMIFQKLYADLWKV